MTLWFENSLGDMRQVAHCDSWAEIYSEIQNFIEQANAAKGPGAPKFKMYYMRTWKDNTTGMTKIDIGSWSEFFYVSEG